MKLLAAILCLVFTAQAQELSDPVVVAAVSGLTVKGCTLWVKGESSVDSIGNYTITGTTDHAAGISGTAINFTSASQYLTVHGFHLNPTISIEFWVYLRGYTGFGINQPYVNYNIFGIHPPTGGGIAVLAHVYWPQTLDFASQSSVYGWQWANLIGNSVGAQVPITLNTWHHIAFTSDASASSDLLRAKAYIDGQSYYVQSATALDGVIVDMTADYDIGGSDNGGNPPDGMLNDFCVYNRVLSAKEIGAIYAAGLTHTPVTRLK